MQLLWDSKVCYYPKCIVCVLILALVMCDTVIIWYLYNIIHLIKQSAIKIVLICEFVRFLYAKTQAYTLGLFYISAFICAYKPRLICKSFSWWEDKVTLLNYYFLFWRPVSLGPHLCQKIFIVQYSGEVAKLIV